MEDRAPRNMMVGQMSHVREVGLHTHQWAEVGAVATGQPAPETYEECALCGTRRVRHGNFAVAAQSGWLGGGEWVGDGMYQHAMPIVPAVGLPPPPDRDVTQAPNVTRGGEQVRKAPLEVGRKGGER